MCLAASMSPWSRAKDISEQKPRLVSLPGLSLVNKFNVKIQAGFRRTQTVSRAFRRPIVWYQVEVVAVPHTQPYTHNPGSSNRPGPWLIDPSLVLWVSRADGARVRIDVAVGAVVVIVPLGAVRICRDIGRRVGAAGCGTPLGVRARIRAGAASTRVLSLRAGGNQRERASKNKLFHSQSLPLVLLWEGQNHGQSGVSNE
jgi:hypothetical protein